MTVLGIGGMSVVCTQCLGKPLTCCQCNGTGRLEEWELTAAAGNVWKRRGCRCGACKAIPTVPHIRDVQGEIAVGYDY